MNGFGKLRRCTDKRKVVVEFYLPGRRAHRDPTADQPRPQPSTAGRHTPTTCRHR